MIVPMFRNRADAADQLAGELKKLELRHPLVLEIPRGGVIMAVKIAHQLRAEADVVLARKLIHPFQPELAIGAVSEDGQTHLHKNAMKGIGDQYLRQETAWRLVELNRRRDLFRKVRPKAAVEGRTVIVMDDGVATGSTMLAALKTLLTACNPHELIAAVPVAPLSVLRRFRVECDRVVCLLAPVRFFAISEFYEDFAPVAGEEAAAALQKFAPST